MSFDEEVLVLLQPCKCGLENPIYFIQVGGTDLVEFSRRNLVVEVDHTVSIAGHLSQEQSLVGSEHRMGLESSGNSLVLGCRLAISFGENMPSKVVEGLQGATQVGLC